MSQNAQPPRAAVEPEEPTAGSSGVPIWLILLLGLLLFWGMTYVDGHGGWFNPEVFAPFHSYAEVSRSQPYNPEAAARALGEATFNRSCALCHQTTGLGKEGQFPPLAGSDWLLAPGPGRIGRIVLNGLSGPIRVEAGGKIVSIKIFGTR